MDMMRELWIVICTVLVSVTSQTQNELNLCLTASYSTQLTCESSFIQVHEEVMYGVNNSSCTVGCCVNDNIMCTKNMPTSKEIFSACNGKTNCLLHRGVEIPVKAIQCPESSAKNATFAVVLYSCVNEPSSTSTMSTIVIDVQKSSTLSEKKTTTAKHNSTSNNFADRTTTPAQSKSDIGLVIGLSVAGGVIIVVIVVVIAVFTARNNSRHGTYDSQNSTKTLASSDVESGNSPELGESTEDVFGFAKSAQGQQERLQKRNDNIKRNLSFKSEESKNKRPPKSSKGSKSKTKSSTLEQRNANKSSSNKPKANKESHKNKQTSDRIKESASQPSNKEKRQSATNGSSTNPDGKRKADVVPHPTDAKSETNLLNI